MRVVGEGAAGGLGALEEPDDDEEEDEDDDESAAHAVVGYVALLSYTGTL